MRIYVNSSASSKRALYSGACRKVGIKKPNVRRLLRAGRSVVRPQNALKKTKLNVTRFNELLYIRNEKNACYIRDG